MAEADYVAIPSEANYVTFDDLHLGISSEQVVGRLLRFWEAQNTEEDGEFKGIVLLFLDEKNTLIHGFIPAVCADDFQEVLKEGVIFNITDFEVGRCTNLYKITDNPFVLRFLPSTIMREAVGVGTTISWEKFRLRKIDHLQALANTNLELPDVVGQIVFVQGSNLCDSTCKQRLVIRFKVDISVIVYLSLWDEVAATFRRHMNSKHTPNSVMVVTTVNPILFGGNLYLNSTQATRIFFESTIHAIQQFTKSLGIEEGETFGRAETMAGIKKKEMITIGELCNYLSKINAQTQDADFLCKAQVIGILQRNGWSYVACTSCNRKLEKNKSNLRCKNCVLPKQTGVVRYRVELAVHDGHNGSTFVVSDREMTKLTNKTAAAAILENVDGDDDNDLPNCLRELAGKEFVFQIRVTPFNYTPKYHSFTVSAITPHKTTTSGSKGDSFLQGQKINETASYDINRAEKENST